MVTRDQKSLAMRGLSGNYLQESAAMVAPKVLNASDANRDDATETSIKLGNVPRGTLDSFDAVDSSMPTFFGRFVFDRCLGVKRISAVFHAEHITQVEGERSIAEVLLTNDFDSCQQSPQRLSQGNTHACSPPRFLFTCLDTCPIC